jgi:hypothetical protein
MTTTKPAAVLAFLTQLSILLLAAPSALAAPLPYATRTHGYAGWSTSARGDIRTVGMGGGAVGLADTFLAAVDNPAGLAMTLNTGDLNYSGNQIRDGYIQDPGSPLALGNFGVALAPYPWGFSAGYGTTYREGLDDDTNIQVREFRLSAARVFEMGHEENRLSIGLSLIMGVSDQTLGGVTDHTGSLGTLVSGMYQLPHRYLLAVSYRPPMRYAHGTTSMTEPAALPGFFQPLNVPGKFEAGLGWIPNRFAAINFGLGVVGTSDNTALFRDDSIRAGQDVTLQPKLGASYVLAEYRHFKTTVFAGGYFESTRIEGAYNRLHGTAGIEAKLLFFTIGAGKDVSAHYQNQLVSIGLDPFKLMEMLEIIPKAWRPPSGGILPNPFRYTDEGLARPLVHNWKPRGPDMDPIKVGLDIPSKIEKKIDKLRN